MSVNTLNIKPLFFASATEFRQWLEKNHDRANEIWVGYYKISSGKRNMSWQESVKVALCFGWIDGIRKGIDEVCYANRFTPRKPKSNWSAINIKNVEDLITAGLMQPSGLKAFNARKVKQ